MQKLILAVLLLQPLIFLQAQQQIYVSSRGNDASSGTFNKPLRSIQNAVTKAASQKGGITIILRGGLYEIDRPLEIAAGSFDSLVIKPMTNEKVTVLGSKRVFPKWEKYNDNIWKARMPFRSSPDQFFLNGKAQQMARYPNYSSNARVFNGTAADAISEDRVATWKNPGSGYIHALHPGEWGAFHYRIIGRSTNELRYEGGWQNNRPAPMHQQHRFVENIFEELDAPGEWYYDAAKNELYFYPPATTDLRTAVFSVSTHTDLVHIKGTAGQPAQNITIQNISFSQTARSFMQVKEPLLRSDWTIYRGGVILVENAEHVHISNCDFFELGGNAVFVSGYNKSIEIRNNHIHGIGANAIAFVGKADAVRSPAFRYENFVPWDSMDYSKGPRSENYPRQCVASGNLIHDIGTIEKQVAGIQISMASAINVAHNTIYQVPRAGINISEGTWGGHVIEYNDVFNTVLETGDHGAFNSWGRDRYWRPQRDLIDSVVSAKPGIELLDAIDPVIIRNNRFHCEHGWDIDLDDGSTNYQIYNNICLNGGLKLREGYHRTVTNNILVNNSFHPHVWLKNSDDVFTHNIVTGKYAPILMNNWGKMIDSNYFLSREGLLASQALGLDKNGSYVSADFYNAARGDYRIREGSQLMLNGFRNIDTSFGVQDPALKKLAAKPPIRPLITDDMGTSTQSLEWLGAKFKNIATLGERSAAGLHNNNGALVMECAEGTLAAKAGLRKGDVIIKMGGHEINSVGDLFRTYQNIKWMGQSEAILIRNQTEQRLNIMFK